MANTILCSLGTLVALVASSATAGDAIVHIPFDSDYLSIVNVESNPNAEELVSGSASGYSLTDDVPGTNIINGTASRPNTHAVRFEKSAIGIDLSKFTDFSSDLTSATVEWFYKGSLDEVTAWKNPLRLTSATSATTAYSAAKHHVLMQLNTNRDPYIRLDSADGTVNTYAAQAGGTDGKWHHLAVTIEPIKDGGGQVTGSTITYFFDHVEFAVNTLSSPWIGAAKEGEGLYLTIGHYDHAAVELDEFRVSKGVLTPREMLWAADPRPSDPPPAFEDIPEGGVFVDFPFDGSFEARNKAYLIPTYTTLGTGGSVSFTESVAASRVVVGSNVCANARAVVLDKASVWLDLAELPWSWDFTGATVEFYTKASPAELTAYNVLLQISSTARHTDATGSFTLLKYQVGKADAHEKGNYGYLQSHDKKPDGSYANYTFVKNGGNDGKWHHIAYTIAPVKNGNGEVTGSSVTAYYDYENFLNYTASFVTPWRGAPETDGQKMFMTLGATGSTVCFDELRISKGVLPAYRWMRLTDFVPQDKDTLLHLSFEGDITSRVDTSDRPPYLGQWTVEPSYSESVWKNSVLRPLKGDLLPNGHSVRVVSTVNAGNIVLPAWCLSEECLDSATIEFFIKCTDVAPAYANPFLLVSPCEGGLRNVFMLQQNGNGNYAFNTYCGASKDDVEQVYWCNNTIPVNDGKWHHVAMTVAPTVDGHSRIDYYFDHQWRYGKTTESQAWRGLRDGSYLRTCHGQDSGEFLVDEVRISKGVLTADEFLKAKHDGGLILLLK